MGAGGIIHQNNIVLKTAVCDDAIYSQLPQHCKDKVDEISQKNVDDWTDDDRYFMASMPLVAQHL